VGERCEVLVSSWMMWWRDGFVLTIDDIMYDDVRCVATYFESVLRFGFRENGQ
jgi:hypothetical protein